MNTKHEVEQNVEGEKEESGKESTEDASVVRKRRMKETLKKDNEQPIVYSKQSLNTTGNTQRSFWAFNMDAEIIIGIPL